MPTILRLKTFQGPGSANSLACVHRGLGVLSALALSPISPHFSRMIPILHDTLPDDAIARPLPGTRPMVAGDWLRRDERFGEQMGLRDILIATQPDAVLGCEDAARDAADELLGAVCAELGIGGDSYARPDGQVVLINRADPMVTLGRLAQEDFVIMLAGEDEHWLAGGVICFPSRWTLAQKIGRSLTRIHRPVGNYDEGMATRVQRLFTAVRVDQPLVRWNHLPYSSARLHNPATEPDEPYYPETRHEVTQADVPPYIRMERQVIKRLPTTGAVIFSIHTYLTRA